MCSSRALDRADQRAADALLSMGRVDVDQFEEVVIEKSPATGVTEQPRVALGDPTRAILKLAPDQIRPATIGPDDMVEGDEAVGERECDKILREMIEARDASLERAKLAQAEVERLEAAALLDQRASAWARSAMIEGRRVP
jgi:hypothetical protein